VPTRAFNGGVTADRVVTSAGLGTTGQGPVTIAALVKITSGFSGTGWIIDGDDGSFVKFGILTSGGPLFYENDFGSGGLTPPTGQWVWIVGSKGTGAAIPRWHVKNVTTGGAWAHGDGTANVNDLSGAATEIVIGGQSFGGAGTTFRGSMAALARWPRVLTDSEVVAYCTSLAKDLRLSEPDWGVLLNQASTATAVQDFTGGGGNQTSVSGTTVDSDVPPGWDDTLPTVEHLFTTQTPTGLNFFENAPVTLSTALVFTADGYVTAGRFFAPTNPTGTYELVLWRATAEDVPTGNGTGVIVGSVAVNQTIKAGQWNTVPFPSPLAVTANTVYKIALRTSVGSYTATNNFFTSEVDSGHIRGLQGSVLDPSLGGTYYNGSYKPDLVSYPNQTFNFSCYFVDVSYIVGSAPAVGASPSGQAVAVNLGNPTVAIPSSSPGGLAVPVALGTPAAALGLSATPSGLAIPVALGQPSVGPAGVSPSGLAIPVATGQPSVSLGRLASPTGLAIPVAIGQPSTLPPVATDGRGRPIVATSATRPIVASSSARRLTQ
jgi:hypothetical protein